MSKFIKDNLILVLAFSIPFIFIIAVVAILYLPTKFVYSNYEFAYVHCSGFYSSTCQDVVKYYNVIDGKISITEDREDMEIEANKITVTHKGVENGYDRSSSFKFFIYNTETGESRKVNISELKELSFFEDDVSPDGYSISREYVGGSDMFPFYYSSSYYGFFLKNNKTRREIILEGGDYSLSNIDLLGWISSK